VRDLLKSAFTSWPHCIATYVCLIGAGWLLACGWKPVRVDFPVEVAAMPANAAQAKADELGGKVWQVGFTGSMKPLLKGGEYVVTVYRYDAIRTGEVLVYTATYHDKPIIHRAVQKDGYGWLMSGDSSPRSESWARVTKDNYLGTAVAAYRKI
jgi:hypothetical protein